MLINFSWMDGKLLKRILVQKGVKQGCLLAPFLFDIFHATDTYAPPPFSSGKKVPILMCDDNAILLTETKVGLSAL